MPFSRLIRPLASTKLTIGSMGLLMLLVAACTLEQVKLGTFGAVEIYFRSFFLYARLPVLGWPVPVFPAGGLVGAVMAVNLAAAMAVRLRWSFKSLGLLLVHLGLAVLVLGEFVTGVFSTEMHMAIEEGRTKNYVESRREVELVLIDHGAPDQDQVYRIRQSALKTGREIRGRSLPLSIKVIDFYPNARLERRPRGSELPPSQADQGIGPGLVVWPAPPAGEDERDQRTAYVELSDKGRPIGTWLVSSVLLPQTFEHEGKRRSLAIRSRREYLPFSLTLLDFKHDVYPGTRIPKNFSSLVRLRHPLKGEDREVLISMNHPLRYDRKAFYQSSYGKDDTLSILQVVENPGWLLPYLSFALVCAGMLLHFGLRLLSSRPPGAA